MSILRVLTRGLAHATPKRCRTQEESPHGGAARAQGDAWAGGVPTVHHPAPGTCASSCSATSESISEGARAACSCSLRDALSRCTTMVHTSTLLGTSDVHTSGPHIYTPTLPKHTKVHTVVLSARVCSSCSLAHSQVQSSVLLALSDAYRMHESSAKPGRAQEKCVARRHLVQDTSASLRVVKRECKRTKQQGVRKTSKA